MTNDTSTKNLILVPAVITLAVTLLRLTGELLHWNPKLFNPAPGGGGALVGIAWLVPVFGAWFGWKLARAGERPASVGKAIGFAVLGFAIMPLIGFVAAKAGIPQQSPATFGIYIVVGIIGAFLAYRAWPGLGRTLFAYALAARIPVAIVMLIAILANWGTHYDVAPPGIDVPANPVAKWFMIGAVPQLTIWIWYTIALGAIAGSIAAAVAGNRQRTA
ncbi:MAG TPA: hypothetical protein VFQ51_14975 [Vicinamibacteria bacterium]|nr:hypothetical protein [Vicinamibacteria bacterium]